jgi:hypothetical protein
MDVTQLVQWTTDNLMVLIVAAWTMFVFVTAFKMGLLLGLARNNAEAVKVIGSTPKPQQPAGPVSELDPWDEALEEKPDPQTRISTVE